MTIDIDDLEAKARVPGTWTNEVVLELVRRVRAAEGEAGDPLWRHRKDSTLSGIVRDLAASNPVQGIYNGGHEVETCALCGATGKFEDELHLTGLQIEHKPTCLKRRAVEATKP